MAFTIPTIGEVVRTVENAFGAEFYGTAGVMRVAVVKLLSKVIGAAVYIPLLACKYIWKNSFVLTADAAGLVKIGYDYSLPHKPATYAHGVVKISADNGVRVPTGTIFVCESNGKEYELLSGVYFIDGGTATREIRATEPGSESNLGSADVPLAFRDSAVPGVSSVIASGVDGGRVEVVQVDSSVEQWGESLEEYRERLKFRRQNQPNGGSWSDYVGWCMRFGFVTKVYKAENWPATNNITLFLIDENRSNYVPSDGEVEQVQIYLNDDSRKPIIAAPFVVAATPVNVFLKLSFTRLSENVQNAVTVALKNFLREYKPGSVVQKTDIYTVVASASGDPLCSVVALYKNGVVADNSVSLDKGVEGVMPFGEVVNVNSLEIEFVKV